MNKKLIIFDLDGTLLNTIADLGNAVNHTLEAHSLPLHTLAEYKRMVGHGMRNLVTSAMPEEKRIDTFIDSFLKEFLDYYLAHIDEKTCPYPGICDMIDELNSRGIKLAVASNKIQAGTERLIEKFFPDIHFTSVCGNCPDFPLKPDAALIEYIMSKAGVSKDETLMVGDSGTDIKTARNAGIPVIAVTWGFRPKEDLTAADHLADSALEVTRIILNHE